MGWFKRRREQRTINETEFPWISMTKADGGVYVTETSAFNLSAVWACETLIADSISTLPVDTFRKRGVIREETVPPAWVEQPNPENDRVDYDTQRILSLLGWGNAYSLLVRQRGTSDPLDPVIERWIVDPNRVQVRRIANVLAWFVDGLQVPSANFQHIPGYKLPGAVLGMSVIEKARQSMGLGQSAENFGTRFYQNGVAPSGVLEIPALPAEVSKDVVERLRETFSERYAGTGNSHKPIALTGGTKWTQITVNPVDAQFLETRKFQIEEIARWFRCPLHKIQQIMGNASQGGGNGLEQMAIEFAGDTLRPVATKLERADSKLLPRGQYERYNTDAYVRTDLAAQTAYFSAGRLGGWLSANDIRRLKDEEPIPNGDIYLQPANMIEAGTTPPKLVPTPGEPVEGQQQNARGLRLVRDDNGLLAGVEVA